MMLSTLFKTLLESAPYIVFGFLIAGVLKFWVPQDVLQKHIGRRSSSSLVKSVCIGSILPLCSCGTIPLGIGLFRNGAAMGNVFAFMVATPILSPVLIVLSLSMLGVKLTVTFFVVAIVGSYTIGLLTNRVFSKLQRDQCNISKSCNNAYERTADIEHQTKNKFVRMLKWSFLELGADVSFDITIGLGIAAFLLTLLPMEWISSWLGQQDFYTLLYVILLGIPAYACSIPSIPVVQSLLLLGATPGAAVVYMIAGPATNLGELNVIRKSMGLKPALFYTMSLFILSLVAGVFTDQFIFPDYQYHAYRIQGELVVQQCCVPLIFGESINTSGMSPQIPLWHWPFGVIMMGIICFGIYFKLMHFISNPCRTCNWKEYANEGVCMSKCHVRRKYEFFRLIRQRFFQS